MPKRRSASLDELSTLPQESPLQVSSAVMEISSQLQKIITDIYDVHVGSATGTKIIFRNIHVHLGIMRVITTYMYCLDRVWLARVTVIVRDCKCVASGYCSYLASGVPIAGMLS